MAAIHFSSGAIPDRADERTRFSQWRDLYVANIGSLDFQASEHIPFRAELDIGIFGTVGVGSFNGTIHRVARTPLDIKTDNRDEYCLMINSGASTVEGRHVGRDATLLPGGATLISSSEAGLLVAAQTTKQGEVHIWHNIIIPGERLRRAAGGVDDLLGHGYTGPALGLLRGYLDLTAGLAGVNDPLVAEHIASTLVDLVTLTIGAKGERAQQASAHGLRSARLDGVLGAIARDFTRPGFSVRALARQQGLSIRYVHDLLHETGLGFSERVLELRLNLALTFLQDRQHDHLRIAELAMLAGFSDVSYFNRCFRRRFGCTPTMSR